DRGARRGLPRAAWPVARELGGDRRSLHPLLPSHPARPDAALGSRDGRGAPAVPSRPARGVRTGPGTRGRARTAVLHRSDRRGIAMNTTSALFALARVALTEALRERILYGLLAFAVGLILLSAVLSNVTLGWPVRIVTDLSLSAISLGGAAMAILLGVRSVASEIERRVAYPVLARPIARWTYV